MRLSIWCRWFKLELKKLSFEGLRCMERETEWEWEWENIQ